MKANELRIGNLVFLYGSQATIIPNDFQKWFQNEPNWENKAFKPIPITEEWLLKFGFEKLNRDVPAYKQDNLIVEWLFERWTGRLYFDAYNSIQIIEVKYVHQLQNLFFALTGEELTIE